MGAADFPRFTTGRGSVPNVAEIADAVAFQIDAATLAMEEGQHPLALALAELHGAASMAVTHEIERADFLAVAARLYDQQPARGACVPSGPPPSLVM